MRALLYYLLGTLLLSSIVFYINPNRAKYTEPPLGENEVSIFEILKSKDKVIWIDARDSVRFEKKHIPGALSLNYNNFEENLVSLLELWEPDTIVIVYCDTLQCDLSHEIADRLKTEVGLDDVKVLSGGWLAWRKATK